MSNGPFVKRNLKNVRIVQLTQSMRPGVGQENEVTEEIRLALLGFGNVGRALTKLLRSKRNEILDQYNIQFHVTGIATESHGSALAPEGLDLTEALNIYEKRGNLSVLSTISPPDDSFDFIQKCVADVLFENTPVNYQDGQPAVDHLMLALERGMHAITANKGPVVHAYRELTALAKAKHLSFLFESTVMDGAPVFSLWREALPAAQLRSFRGVLNSTTNLILTLMEEGKTFEAAVAYAQEIGIAETDPSGDIDGWDAAIKVSALITVLMDIPFKPNQVTRQGIRGISKEIVMASYQSNRRWKLICEAHYDGDQVSAFVRPMQVNLNDPLFTVMGTSSAITFQSDVLGALTLVEENPGPHTTAYGLLADFLNAIRSSKYSS
jgi:homoserine dehydrogenase